MGWRTIYVSSEQKIKIKNNHLFFMKQDNQEVKYHIEDIDLLMIDNIKSIITLYSLIKLAENNVSLVINDQKHDPIGLYIPFNTHHKPVKNLKLQILLTENDKKILHQKIIFNKILNQQKVSETIFNLSQDDIDKFELYKSSILIGDVSNREGHAAKLFYKLMYGSSFVRFKDDGINNALNFGYKILSSRISSSLIKFGLHPSLGFIHITETNFFNLTYDFIEPFRPLVDYFTKKNEKQIDKELSLLVRLNLLKILDYFIHIDGKIMKVRNAIDYMVKTFLTFLNTKDFNSFKLPEIVVHDLEEYNQEEGEEDEF